MTALKDNKDVASFLCTKHAWKGKYRRIFSVGTQGITTYNPSSMEKTNQWPYSDIVNISPPPKSQFRNEFVIYIRKGKKTETMKFSHEYRAEVLSEALKFRHMFADTSFEPLRYNAQKHHWSDSRISVVLEITQCSLDQRDPATGRVLVSYMYKDVENLVPLSDYPGAFAVLHGGFQRMHLFVSDRRDEVMKKVVEFARNYIGVNIKLKNEPISYEAFISQRLGTYSSDEAVTSVCEFNVHKISPRNGEFVKRILALSEYCVVERDPTTYSVTTIKPLSEIFALIRSPDNPQLFCIEYVKGQIRYYTSTERDALLATLLDGVRASGNKDIHVKMKLSNRGRRLGPWSCPAEEEVESSNLKILQTPPAGWTFQDAVLAFNSNVAYSGLLHSVTQDGLFAENKEKLIQAALLSLVDKEDDQNDNSNDSLEEQFQALRRLVASKAGFASFTQLARFRERLGIKVVKALKKNNDAITHAAVDMLCALMQPMHDDYDLRQEQLNKSSLLSSKNFLENLLEVFRGHVERGTGALVVSALLDFLTFALCAPYSETTEGTYFDTLLTMVAAQGRSLFRLFQHPSLAIVKGAGLVMKAIIEEGEAEIAARMQDLALAEGALPRHLHIAMFTPNVDSRFLAVQQLSRQLVTLWVTGHPIAMGLLKRVVPAGLLSFLDSAEKPPKDALNQLRIRDNLKLAQDHSNKNMKNIPQSLRVIEKHVEFVMHHWREKMGLQKKEDKLQQRPVVLRKRRERIKSEANWLMFYYQFNQDHAQPDLIWNYRTREELRDALENEMRNFNLDMELCRNATVSWNHTEFEVHYASLGEEIKIGDYYLRLLLEEDGSSGLTGSLIKRPYEFFNDLYHRFLLTTKIHMRAMCLQSMAIVYGRHYDDIGPFNDTRYIVGMLEKSKDKLERDRLILFISKLILNKRNVKELMDSGGIRVLVDLLTLAHLHTSRATVPTQTNVIEASPDMMLDTEKEWYFGNAEKERKGPYGFGEMKEFWKDSIINERTRCWAQGMDGWKPLTHIPQLKWCLLASGTPVMNESDLATQILNMLITVCEYFPSRDADGAIVRPLPKVKRILSEAACLPHIVQLLLTFDPVLVEKVSTLLTLVMQDNPAMPKLYVSGLFFFILMYTGSNLLPIGRLLYATHTSQAFRSEENQTSDILQRSILRQLLPEAMVCYLENYGPEKFAQIFLGEFDTPEAIWNSEMRRLMIEKIAAHIAEFTPRLRSNTRALYQYCPIPTVQYPQLENELFCNIYYLKHLCDTQRFPDWPIKDPLKLLRDILEAWKKEVEKKPPSMSIDDAYTSLGLKTGEPHDENEIRKAYFRLAQRYHPDKNPDGRDKFEEVNKAYEFLCSKSAHRCDGPDPHNIILILRAQSILFSRCKEELHPYKYAGYPMLIKTLEMETKDEHLFSKPYPLLAPASETAFHTVNCSALNAEELRREGGLEILQEAFSRCVAVLSHSSRPDEVPVQVCTHICRCFTVAACFPACRERMTQMESLIKDICRILYFRHLTKLCSVAVECVTVLAREETLQSQLFKSGVLFHLLLFLFNYDFTHEEGGVETSDESNKQEVANQLAKLSIHACTRLGGYGQDEEATPKNAEVRHALSSMLTPYLARQLGSSPAAVILKVLNSNTENPYLIWNNGTRAELMDYLESQQKSIVRSGECDSSFGTDFVFSAHSSELAIGEIFVRVFNEQPTFTLENPKGFTLDLLDYLGSQAQYLHSLMSLAGSNMTSMHSKRDRLESIQMALEALQNVIRNNPGVEIQCIGHFKLLFSLLRIDGCTAMQGLAINVIAGVTGNQECVNDIAACDVLVNLLLVLYAFSESSRQVTVLETLLPLMSNSKLVKDAVAKGAVIYLVDLFCNSPNPTVRERAAELLAKIGSDKLVGPKARIAVGKFLPTLFLDAMKDSPETAAHMFEGTQENPELIWNDEAREKVCEVVRRLAKEHYDEQKQNPTKIWRLPDDFTLSLPTVEGEVVVAGVYLGLFVKNPSWVLRRPREFLTELLDKAQVLVNKASPDKDVLELVTTALTCLFQAQPTMLDQVPTMGYIPAIVRGMNSSHDVVNRSCLSITREFANNKACVDSLVQCNCLPSIVNVMQKHEDMATVACETFKKMFESEREALVHQALQSELVTFLLQLLERKLNSLPNAAATKAQIVQALKSMAESSQYGMQVSALLEKSQVWADYKDQKHDLFISENPAVGYLTGTVNVAGYLTQGTAKNLPSSPPPMDDS